jgi:hypothetical protein
MIPVAGTFVQVGFNKSKPSANGLGFFRFAFYKLSF